MKKIMFGLLAMAVLFSCDKETENAATTPATKSDTYVFENQKLNANDPADQAILEQIDDQYPDLNIVYGLEEGVVYLYATDDQYVDGLVSHFPEDEAGIRMRWAFDQWSLANPNASYEERQTMYSSFQKEHNVTPAKWNDNCLGQPDVEAYLYEHTNYGGSAFLMGAETGQSNDIAWMLNGINNLWGSLSNWNDQISSVYVSSTCGEKAELSLWEHAEYGGKKIRCITTSTLFENLTDIKWQWWKSANKANWNDKVSSAKLRGINV